MKKLFLLLPLIGSLSSCHDSPAPFAAAKSCNCWDDTTFHVQGVTGGRFADTNHKSEGNDTIPMDTRNERFLKDTFYPTNGNSIGGWYHLWQYDYGRPAPGYSDIIRWAMGDSIPKCFNEWQVSIQEVTPKTWIEDDRWEERWYVFTCYCPNHRSKLPKYCDSVIVFTNHVTETTEVKVIQNKDTLSKYINDWVKNRIK